MNRSTSRTVTFTKPFLLAELDGIQPAGCYTIETEEELLQALSFEAWRRLSTTIRLPRRPGGPPDDQVAEIDPVALDAALALDTGPTEAA
jgi:hypothetical protein